MILPFDEVALQFVQQFANPALDVFFLLITELGNPIVWLFAAAFIYWLDRENDAFFLVNLVTFSAAIGGIVKVIVARPRPDVEIFRVIGTDGLGFSFPSAHAMVAASAYGYFGRAIKGHGGKILALMAVLVAISRVYIGVHFVTDVIAGLLIGYFIGRANRALFWRLRNAKFHLTKLEDELGIVVAVLVALVAIMFVQPLSLAEGIIGFYAGFFAFKFVGQPVRKKKGMRMYIRQGIGFAVLLALIVPAYAGLAGSYVLEGALYFTGGLWVSFIWPVLSAKIGAQEKFG